MTREERKAAGLCVDCHSPAKRGIQRCEPCARLARERAAQSRERRMAGLPPVDHWHERTCQFSECGKTFRPTAKSPAPAKYARYCSRDCQLDADRARRRTGKPHNYRSMEVTGLDLIPCLACGLRGHLAGDPDRCLGSSELVSATRGLGAWQ